MSYYGGTITVAGRNLITSLIAGETIRFTRILVGTGAIPEGIEPVDMTELVNPVAEGTSTVPTLDNGAIHMTVEYRNDLNGGLKEGFWLREFGIYARTDKTEEILLYYATLGDYPQPVNAYQDNRIDIRRYPVTIALELDADVQIAYNPGAFITSGEAFDMIDSMVDYALQNIAATITAKIIIPSTGWTLDEKNNADITADAAYPFYIDVPCEKSTDEYFPNLALNKASLETAERAGLCPTIMAHNGALRLWSKTKPDKDMLGTAALLYSSKTDRANGMRTTIISDFVIPESGWTSEEKPEINKPDDFIYCVDVRCDDATENHFPNVALEKSSLEVAAKAGLCPTVKASNGSLRFWAKKIPNEDISGTAALVYARGKQPYVIGADGKHVVPVATSTAVGGVVVQEGSGLKVDDFGNLSINTMTDEDLSEIFGKSNTD